MSKILFVITTFNHLKFTKLCMNSLSKIKDCEFNIIIIDDCSTDETVKWCNENGIKVIDKEEGLGLTHSWNVGYKYFKDNNEYKYLILSNNDILVPNGALNELVEIFERWPFSLVVPMTSITGAGHNGNVQGIENIYPDTQQKWVNDPNNYQEVQDRILATKEEIKKKNNVYLSDPVRMKMFNGFFFMVNRNVINYERKDGNLFDPKKIMFKAEDEFNWATLIPNNDYPAICKTSFIFHFKGITTNEIQNYVEIANDSSEYFKFRGKSYLKGKRNKIL